MALGVDNMRPGRVVFKVTMLTVGTLGFVFCLTLLYEAMREVMDVGGACASGGAYQIRQQCPQGVAWVTPLSIFGMLAFTGISFVGVFSKGGPRPYAFAWSALFLAPGLELPRLRLRRAGRRYLGRVAGVRAGRAGRSTAVGRRQSPRTARRPA
jgi:hypothetical protein